MFISTVALLSLVTITVTPTNALFVKEGRTNPDRSLPPRSTEPPDAAPAAILTVCSGYPGFATDISFDFDTGIKMVEGICPPMDPDFSSSSFEKPTPTFHPIHQPTARSLSERGGCNYPQNTCAWIQGGSGLLGFARCGKECTTECYMGSGGPDPNECQVIFDWFQARQDQVFTLGRDRFILYTYGSCGTGIQNSIRSRSWDCSADMIYDYNDWAGVGHWIATGCQSWQGARGGKCTASEGADFWMQVYRN